MWCTRCLLLYLLYLPPKHPKTICHPRAFTPNEPFSTQNCIPNNSYTKQYTKRPWQQKLFHQTTFRSEGSYTRQILHETFAPNNLSIKQLFPALKQKARRNLEEILEGSDGSQAGALAVNVCEGSLTQSLIAALRGCPCGPSEPRYRRLVNGQ